MEQAIEQAILRATTLDLLRPLTRSSGSLRRVAASLLLGLVMGLALPAGAQSQPDEPPKTFGEAMGRQIGDLGASMGEYRQLQTERRTRIADLERQVSACGRCKDAQRLAQELSDARRAEAMIAGVEASTLQSLGLGSYASSFDELLVALTKGLSTPHDFGSELSRRRIGDVVQAHCSKRAMQDGKLNLKAVGDCAVEKNPDRQFVMFGAALRLCQEQAGDNYARLCRSAAGCDAFEACMRRNSEAVALCVDNMERGLQPKLPRCFTTMLDPGLFGREFGADDRKARRDKQRAETEQRAEDQRDRRCKMAAERLERRRESAARRPDGNRLLERDEAAYARDCGG